MGSAGAAGLLIYLSIYLSISHGPLHFALTDGSYSGDHFRRFGVDGFGAR